MGQYGQYVVPAARDLINFGVGQPALDMLPLAYIREASAHRLAGDDPMLLQYGFIPGYKSFRQTLSQFLEGKINKKVDPDHLFISNGVTQALALICSLYAKHGDIVVVEEPTYFLALNIFKDYGISSVGIPMDSDGMRVDILEEKLKNGFRPKFMYTIPVFHNPTAFTLSHERRVKLIELSKKYGFFIIADEVYQLLSYPGNENVPPPLYYYNEGDEGTVFSIGSFSKILAPSLRVGWIQAKPNLLAKLLGSGQLDSSGGLNPIMSGVVHSAIELGLQEKHLQFSRETLGKRAKELCAALKAQLPSYAKFNVPGGGYFVWIELPKHWDGEELAALGRANHKVVFHPGIKFGLQRHFIRLSVSYYDVADMVEIGVPRIVAAMKEFEGKHPIVPDARAAWEQPLSVAVHGGSGRLGSLIVDLLKNENIYAGTIGRSDSVPASTTVVVDVSSAEGTRGLLKKLSKQPLIVGTTGDLPMDELKEYAKVAPVYLVPNFSIGVPLLSDLVKTASQAVPSDWSIEVTESHHTAKKDAPSGTAKKLVAAINRPDVPTHSLRLGDTVGEHTVFLAGPGERIELKHFATMRNVFAIGALRLSRAVVNDKPGLYYK